MSAPEAIVPPPSRRAIGAIRALAVVVVAGVSAILAVAADTAPTGEATPDVVLPALLGAGVVLAGACAPWWLLAVAAIGAGVASREPLHVAACLVAVAACIPSAVLRRRIVVLGAVSAAVVVQVALRLDLAGLGRSAAVAAVLCVAVILGGVAAGPPIVRAGVALVTGAAALVAIAGVGGTAIASLLAQQDAQAAVERTSAALDALVANQPERAAASFAEADVAFARVGGRVDSAFTAAARWVPVLAQHRAAAGTLVGEGGQLAAVASSVAERIDPGVLRLTEGVLDPVGLLSLDAPLTELADTLAGTRAAVEATWSPWLIAPLAARLDDLDERLADVAGDVTTARDAVAVLPALVGAEGPRRYGVVFLNPSRPTALGGSIEGWFTFTAADGQLSGDRIGPASDLEPEGRPVAVDLIDVPSAASLLADRLEEVTGEPMDGVVLLDPHGLAGLLRLVGPVTVPGVGPLDGDSIAEHLLRGQYTGAAADTTGQVGVFVVSKVLGATLPTVDRVAEVMGPIVDAGRVSAWLRDPDEQEVLSRLGVDGAMPLEGDVLAVAVADLGASRLGAFLESGLAYRATVDPATASVDATVTVRIANRAPSELAPTVAGTADTPGTALLAVDVHTKLDAGRADLDGRLSQVTTTTQGGLFVHRAEVAVPSGATVVLRLELEGVAGTGPVYRVAVRPQPAANPPRLDLLLVPKVGGLRVVGDSPLGPGGDPGSLVFGGELREPLRAEITGG